MTRRVAIGLGASAFAGVAGWHAHDWRSGGRNRPDMRSETTAPSRSAAPGQPLPAWIVASYWQPYTFETVSNVPTSFDMVTMGFIHGVGDDDVRLDLGPALWKDVAEVCRDRVSKGQKWLVSVGGGANLAQLTPLLTRFAAKKLADYVSALVDEFHVRGIDLDLESGPAGYDEESVLWLCAELKRRHGDHFLVTAAPRPFEIAETDQTWGSIVAHGVQQRLIDLVTIQFYDTDAATNKESFKAWVDRTMERAQNRGLPAQVVLVGIKPPVDEEKGMDVVATAEAVSQLQSRYGVRGANIWHVGRDAAHSGAFLRNLLALKG